MEAMINTSSIPPHNAISPHACSVIASPHFQKRDLCVLQNAQVIIPIFVLGSQAIRGDSKLFGNLFSHTEACRLPCRVIVQA